MSQTQGMDDGFLDAAGRMSEDEFLGRYGPWDPMAPAEVAAELAGCAVPWGAPGAGRPAPGRRPVAW